MKALAGAVLLMLVTIMVSAETIVGQRRGISPGERRELRYDRRESGMTPERYAVIAENCVPISENCDETCASFSRIAATMRRDKSCALIAGRSGLTTARSAWTAMNYEEIVGNDDGTFATFTAITAAPGETRAAGPRAKG